MQAQPEKSAVLAAIRAQQQVGKLQGQQHTWFCGAWTGYGFHEDGLKSAMTVARSLGVDIPWQPSAEARPEALQEAA